MYVERSEYPIEFTVESICVVTMFGILVKTRVYAVLGVTDFVSVNELNRVVPVDSVAYVWPVANVGRKQAVTNVTITTIKRRTLI